MPDRRTTNGGLEIRLEGLAVGPGVAIGTVFVHDARFDVLVREQSIPETRIKSEQRRLQRAIDKAAEQLREMQDQARDLPAAAGEELGYLLVAYQQMLHGSRLVRGAELKIESERINAEAAVVRVIDEISAAFAGMEDSYLAARGDDIRDVGGRLIRILARKSDTPWASLPNNAIIVADELSPADTAQLDTNRVAGFATQLGGVESHTAIMARSLSLPAVVAVPQLVAEAYNGAQIVIDGTTGTVILNPSQSTLTEYRRGRANYLRQQRALNRFRTIPAVTKDGISVTLQANIELPNEVDAVLDAGAEGIGLLRSEFMFMNRADMPSEDEQVAGLSKVVRKMKGKPVTIRTLDVGADKLGDGLGIKPGPNPALGLRAIRFSLKRREVLDAQLRAILRVAALGPVRILVPMVSTPDEIRLVRRRLVYLMDKLKAEDVAVPKHLPALGVMIEVPGAALAADSLAQHADFFAIGTNDLTQYTLAIDRTDETVAYLYNSLHVGVLKLIEMTALSAQRNDIACSICGEMAGDPRLVPVLLGLGIRELSMSAASIPRVKRRTLSLRLTEFSDKISEAVHTGAEDALEGLLARLDRRS